MIFNFLELTNYGLFKEARFDLRPSKDEDGHLRNIILFGGKNGAGKTTILDAVRLCLYGRRSQGTRVKRKDYESFLKRRIHRSQDPTLSPNGAAVALEFEHVHAGKKQRFRVERSWHDTGNRVNEQFSVTFPGGDEPDLDQAHWEEFVSELIPPGVSQLFFFDGEKIQSMAEEEGKDSELAQSVQALLGLDLTERLQTDLSIYLRREQEASGSDLGEQTLVELRNRENSTEQDLQKVVQKGGKSFATIGRLQSKIAKVERKLSAEGGSFARQREKLLERRVTAEIELGQVEGEIQTLVEHLLPFALIPDRCLSLKRTLESDQEHRDQRAITKYIEQKLPSVADTIRNSQARDTKQSISDLESLLRDELLFADEAPPPVHQAGEAKVHRLLEAIELATQELPAQAATIAKNLELITRELTRVENALKKAPKDDVISPFLQELGILHSKLSEENGRHTEFAEHAAQKRQECEGLKKQIKKEETRLADAEGVDNRIQLAAKVQRVVTDFASQLRAMKVNELRTHFQKCFESLARKEDLLTEIKIDPESFEVAFLDKAGRTVRKSELSAGEKQIYAIAILWGLALTSQRPLPFLIDTPLGRLDSDHRAGLVRDYFPQVSHQVLIFSTDTEIDQDYFQELEHCISKAYRLNYDNESNSTLVEDGYFWIGNGHDNTEMESPAA